MHGVREAGDSVSVQRGVIGGAKMSQRHSTFIHAARALIVAAKRDPRVAKVVLGEIKPVRAGIHRLKINHLSAGLRLTVRGTHAVQTIFIYTNSPAAVATMLEAVE